VGRFVLNFSFCLAVLSLVPRRLLFVPLLVWQVWAGTALSYYAYFDRPLTLQTAKSTFAEGAAVAGMGLGLLGTPTLLLLLVALTMKGAMVLRARRLAGTTWKVGIIALVAW